MSKELLMHRVIEREQSKMDDMTTEIRKTITDLKTEGDRLFEKYGAAEARPVWLVARQLERSLRRSSVRRELVGA